VDVIHICDLEVYYRVGVPDTERARPQPLQIDIKMEHDFSLAAKSDDLDETIDYFAVCQRVLKFGENREWKLIESLADELARTLLDEFGPASVRVEVKKFIIRETKFVSVAVQRS
jgi:7,8-dihydroneopterin aldolase/epimerase/oxygenase